MTLARVLAWNRKLAPLVDTFSKLWPIGVALVGAAGFALWTMVGGYLGLIGQPALPLKDAGDWTFVLLFGAFVWLLTAWIVLAPAAISLSVRGTPFTGYDAAALRRSYGWAAGATLLLFAAALVTAIGSAVLVIFAIIVAGGLIGATALVAPWTEPSHWLLACIGHAALSFAILVWSVCLFTLALPVIAGASSYGLASVGVAVLAAVLLALSIFAPVAGCIVGMLTATLLFALQLSPGNGFVIAQALYAANLGGGRPAPGVRVLPKGEICNLGVAERPALFYQAGGCDIDAARARLRQLKGRNSLQRRTLLEAWRDEARVELTRQRP